MAKIARAFDRHTQSDTRRYQPPSSSSQDNGQLPWAVVPQGSLPPMMFQLRRQDGSKNSYAYSDLREVYCRDAGLVVLTLQSIAKYRILLEGRHLSALADWFSLGSVRWVQEADFHCDPKPESTPEIVRLTIEVIPD